MDFYVFAGVFICVFALVIFFLGLLTAYFGSGKSRMVGLAYVIAGIVIGLVYSLYHYVNRPGFMMGSVIYPAIFYGLAIILGAVAALGVFILGIIKT